MVRVILIGIGVVSSVLAAYVAKRKLFCRREEELTPELRIYQSNPRPRKRKARCPSVIDLSNNGEPDQGSRA